MRTSVKSPEKVLKYYHDMTGPIALQPLCDTFKLTQTPSLLKYIGFVTHESDLPIVFPIESARSLVASESEWATECMMYLFHLSGQRLRSLLYHLDGLPGVLPALIDDLGEAEAKSMRARLKVLDALHLEAKDVSVQNPDVAKQVQQSFLSDPIPNHSMEMLRVAGFESTPTDMQDAIKGLFGLGQTIINEQANRAARNSCEREADHLKMSVFRLMMFPI